MTLPRIYQIVVEMDRHAREELARPSRRSGKIDYMALIGDNQVRMANICAYTANSINGVSKLHSEITGRAFSTITTCSSPTPVRT